jgi:peptide/nickel transport system substrate-binding protein
VKSRIICICITVQLLAIRLTVAAPISQCPSTGDTYVDASIGDASFLNPILATDSASGDIVGLVYNGLLKYDKNLRLIGSLAESWEVKDGGLRIVFHLRKGVRWHDGEPFTSKDVEFTYEKLVDPGVRTPYGADFALIKKLKTPDPQTVEVLYKEPFAPALESWTMGIIPEHVFRNGDFNGHPANRHPIGTGPFKFLEWKTDEKIVLVENPDDFEGRPCLDRYIYRIIPDEAVQFLELRQQGIDSMTLTPDQYNAYPEFFERYNKFRYPAFMYTYLGFNLRKGLFKDRRVRLAIAHAMNKEEIIKGVLLGFGRAATGPYPPSSWAFDPTVKDVPYDPAAAKALLAEAGWKPGKDGWLERDGRPFEFTLMTNQGNKLRELTGQIVQSRLAQVGIHVKFKVLEWSSFIHDYIDKKDFDAVILGWTLGRDPDQYTIWHSDQIGEGQYNFVSYSNPEVDHLLEAGRRTYDLKTREKIYHKIHRLIADDLPYVFLYYPEALPVTHKRIKGPEVAPAGIGWNFQYWNVPKNLQRYKMSF